MTLRDFVDRYGLPLGVLAVFALVLALLPGNTDETSVTTFEDAGAEQDGDSPSALGGRSADAAPPATDASAAAGASVSGQPSTDGDAPSSGQVSAGQSSAPTGGGAAGPTVPSSTTPADSGDPAAAVFGEGPQCDANGRQIGISGYMPPCVRWTGGDNGGATARGVTRDTVKIAIWQGQEDPATRQALSGARLNDSPAVVERMYEALRRYFNNHYQTYGRELVFVEVQASGESTSDEAMKADAIKIADEIGAFATFTGNGLAPIPTTLARELAQRGVVCICTTSLSSAFYTELPPLIWSALPTIDEYAQHSAEYIAKRMGFDPAEYGGLGTVGTPRVYCLMYLTGTGETVSPEGPRAARIFREAFAARGISFETEVAYFYDPGSNQNDVTAMIAKFKSEGCTTLVPLVDPIMPILITREATNQAYFPEWFIVGTGLSDTTTIGRFYDQQQWGNAFGISPLWVTWDVVENSAGYNEFHHGMPGRNKGDEGALINVYRSAFQTLWTGIHMAGPNLTPDTFAQGMYAYPATGGTPASPLVFRTREAPTEIKDFSEVWYDPNRVGPDERTETGTGMIVRADGGKRYDAGEWPQSPPSRNNPVTVTAEQGVHVDHAADGHRHETACLSCGG